MPELTKALHTKRQTLAVVIGAALIVSAGASAGEIEEVTVTAQMRTESLKDVPMAVSAFSGDTVKNSNLSDFKDLFALTPGVSGETNDSFFDAVSVRGVNNNSFGSGSDPALGVFLDGVYQSRTGATPSMYDLERVEVIKGPQGTLFGRNTASGAISMVSRKPGDRLAGEISVGAGQFGREEMEGALDIPLSENLAVRLAGMHRQEDGYIENLAGGPDLGASETDAMRITAVYSGLRNTTITLMAQYEDRAGDGTIYRALDTNADYDQVYNDTRGKDESEIGDLILTVEHELTGGATLSAITGYKTHNFSYVEDFDGTASPIDVYTRDQSGDFFSQEFRLASNNSGIFNYVVGASYYQEDLKAFFTGVDHEDFICDGIYADEWEEGLDTFDTCASLPQEALDEFFGLEGDPWEYAPDMLSVEAADTVGDYSGWGVFANTTFDFTDATSLGLGARYTRDKKSYSVDSPWPDTWTGGWNYQSMYTDGPITGSSTWSNVSGRATLTHHFDSAVTGYASVATGYKSGGFDYLSYRITDPAYGSDEDSQYAWLEEQGYEVNADNAEPSRFDEEKVLSYELGLKARLLDNRLAVNAAAFQYTYDDLQQAFFIGAAAVTRNVGESTGQGVELDARWLITDDLDLYLGLAWLDTEFSGAPEALCEDCDGNEMAFAPRFSAAAVLTYSQQTSLGEIAYSAEYTFTGEQWSDLENTEAVRLDSRNVINLRAALTSADDSWTAGIYAENLFDEEYYHWGYAEALYNLPATKTDPSRGRLLGVNLDYRF
ncbi:TonB-dependent receptor [Microbulbifer thermotolerans]|uniref:TonB-dependent receptor n=1 Tax=Microbulbifer thermotolerans TaxID=252514 RepID=UPI0008EE2E61|nr:TonB-dependent receptor [Microbulbifer thermotolerans]MCX2782428.1 TonB-dependent receptor [Microbulbifer thermotolerans]WKT62151.1 TonB-dependent receptor [Microbulbifer thermotolerans]SFB83330.1 iron complex outermembrane recepter protein [Microbulbifer thermotolerans]